MRGIHGLVLAIGLGIAAALFNYAYLNMRSKDVEKVSFVGIARDRTIDRGARLTDDDLVPVGIPAKWVGNLDDFAVLYADRQTVIGETVARTVIGGTLLLEQDLRTPPPELKFSENLPEGVEERAMFVPVDARAFVPTLVEPGDLVDFLVAKSRLGLPTPATPVMPDEPGNPDQPADAAEPSEPPETSRAASGGPTELIGPFKVLSLGNRLGSADVLRAARIPQVQENVMTISVHVINGELEPKAQKLAGLIQATDFRLVGILLHNRQKRKR